MKNKLATQSIFDSRFFFIRIFSSIFIFVTDAFQSGAEDSLSHLNIFLSFSSLFGYFHHKNKITFKCLTTKKIKILKITKDILFLH